MKTIFLTILLFMNEYVYGYKVMVITLLPSKSHHNLCAPIADTLAKNGNEVIFISPFKRKTSPCSEIAIPEIMEYKNENPLFGFAMTNMTMLEMMSMMADMQPKLAEFFMENIEVKRVFNDKSQKVDLLIVEFFVTDFLFGLGVKFDCPIIVISPISMINTLSKIIGNPYSIATVPNAFLGKTSRMNLLERVQNFFTTAMEETTTGLYTNHIQKKLYDTHFPRESELISFEESKRRVSLIFSNTHSSISVPRPLLPNVIEIGGYHIDEPELLPQDIESIVESAQHGVIYFSLGSVIKGSEMDAKMKESLLKVFSKRKETVLWKFEEDIPEKSKNIVIRKWMPQNSILAHPKVKLFITHGGLLSCMEAANFGVPLIVIPVFGDQPHNAKMVEERAQGVILNLNNITEASLTWALNEMLSNPIYSKNAIDIQKLFRDRPVKPRDLINYYSDLVVRTKGAKHLSPPYLSRCSLMLLDVYAVILTCLIVLLYIISIVCQKICCRKKNQLLTQDKKNN